MDPFSRRLRESGIELPPVSVATLQANITRLCNQACRHCHVDASPKRREMMTDGVLERCLEILGENQAIGTLDITGGAPELHPRFRELVERARGIGKHVMVRHNLTVTVDPHPVTDQSMSYLPDFLAGQNVEVISSLPYYRPYMTDRQRGGGVFDKSIESLRRLNAVGYGTDGLILNLVYNPVGPYLPPAQAPLELEYKKHLVAEHGVHFNRLYTITNMPIHRFALQLARDGQYESYLELLVDSFNPAAAEGVMCRSMVSVSYDGLVYDCDFNQMLGMACEHDGRPLSVFEFTADRFLERDIRFGAHCFGCTAGAGSSCGGATA